MATSGALTTKKLIASIKRRCMIPTSQDTFTDADLIDFCNEEMMIGIVPKLMQMKEEYLVFDEYVKIESEVSAYTVPERALGSKLREASYVDSIDQGTANSNEYELTQIGVDDRYTMSNNTIETSNWKQFYMEGADLVLFPDVGSNPSGYIRFFYHIRPGTLVQDAEVAVIASIDRTTGVILLANAPTKFQTGKQYDFVRARSPHNIISIDKTATNFSSGVKTIQFDLADIPKNLQVGDYISSAGESCIPSVPTELHSILAQRVAQRVLESIGDTQGLTNATAKLQEMEMNMSIMLQSRVEGAPRKVVNRNSTMRRNNRGNF